MIFNQREIPKEQWRYGFRSSAAVGCGWIATYNALHLLGYRTEPENLIGYYERQLPLIHGNLGTTLLAPAVCVKQMGFPAKVVTARKEFDQAAKNADACILYYRWHKKWKFGGHFVALEYKDGKFVGYNTYRNSTGPDVYGSSLQAFLDRRKFYAAVLIAIHKKSRP